MNDNWYYTKARIISKEGVVLFDGDMPGDDEFFDNNIELCKGAKHEAYCKKYIREDN